MSRLQRQRGWIHIQCSKMIHMDTGDHTCLLDTRMCLGRAIDSEATIGIRVFLQTMLLDCTMTSSNDSDQNSLRGSTVDDSSTGGVRGEFLGKIDHSGKPIHDANFDLSAGRGSHLQRIQSQKFRNGRGKWDDEAVHGPKAFPGHRVPQRGAHPKLQGKMHWRERRQKNWDVASA
jgi:hypothetical protein